MKNWIQIIIVLSFSVACSLKKQQAPINSSQNADDSSTEELIVGGRTVTKKNQIAATTVSLLDTQQGTLCTATLLSHDVALTAAHCVEGSSDFMQLSFGLRSVGQETRPIVDVAVTPIWSQHQKDEFNNGDMALVRFSGGLPEGAMAATLMKASHRLTDGEIVTLAGFGILNGQGDGAGRLRTVDVKIANAHYSQTEVSIDQTHQKGACHGDSGGPAFIQDNDQGLLLWGVTSRGIKDPSDLCSGESVYSRIQPYIPWINRTLRAWQK